MEGNRKGGGVDWVGLLHIQHTGLHPVTQFLESILFGVFSDENYSKADMEKKAFDK